MKISTALLISLLAISCSDSKDDKKTSTTAFKLSSAELAAPSNMTALTQAELKETIEASEPYANDGESLDEESDTCFEDLAAKAFIPSIAGSVMNVNAQFDASECIKKAGEANGATVNSASAMFYFDVTYDCTGKDLSALVGKALPSDFNAVEYCSNGFKAKVNTKNDITVSYKINGQNVSNSSVSIDAKSTASNDLCTIGVSGATRTENACVEISKTTTTGSEESVSYKKLVSNNLVWTPSSNKEFYTSGSYTASFNDWNGTITFSGASTAPAYSMTKGSATATGTIPLDSMSLKSSFRKSLLVQKNLILKAQKN